MKAGHGTSQAAKKPHRIPGVELERPEWFGTAFHSVDGMQHLDVRPSGNGILITATPAEGNGRPAQWQLRLRNEDRGQGLRDLGTALVAGRAHLFGLYGENFLAFTPDIPDEGVGALVRAREVTGGSEVGVVVERRAERPMALWAEAGENLLRLLPLLNTAETVLSRSGGMRALSRLRAARLRQLALIHAARPGSPVRAVQTVRGGHDTAPPGRKRCARCPAAPVRPGSRRRNAGIGHGRARDTGPSTSSKLALSPRGPWHGA
ncbi:hypothetical protein GCM10020000_81260 [Streptomyces olivoverticillatus]